MGNVNETQEREDGSVAESSLETSSPVHEYDNENLSGSNLDREALDADLPIKLFIASDSLESDLALGASKSSTSTTPCEENASQSNVESLDELGSYADVSRDDSQDSFPLSDSVLPSSFDLLAEPSPVISDSSGAFHTPDVSQLDIAAEEENIPISITSPSSLPTVGSSGDGSSPDIASGYHNPQKLFPDESQSYAEETISIEGESDGPVTGNSTQNFMMVLQKGAVIRAQRLEDRVTTLPPWFQAVLNEPYNDASTNSNDSAKAEDYDQNPEPFACSESLQSQCECMKVSHESPRTPSSLSPIVSPRDVTNVMTTDVGSISGVTDFEPNEQTTSADRLRPDVLSVEDESDEVGPSSLLMVLPQETLRPETEADIAHSVELLDTFFQTGEQMKSNSPSQEATSLLESDGLLPGLATNNNEPDALSIEILAGLECDAPSLAFSTTHDEPESLPMEAPIVTKFDEPLSETSAICNESGAISLMVCDSMIDIYAMAKQTSTPRLPSSLSDTFVNDSLVVCEDIRQSDATTYETEILSDGTNIKPLHEEIPTTVTPQSSTSVDNDKMDNPSLDDALKDIQHSTISTQEGDILNIVNAEHTSIVDASLDSTEDVRKGIQDLTIDTRDDNSPLDSASAEGPISSTYDPQTASANNEASFDTSIELASCQKPVDEAVHAISGFGSPQHSSERPNWAFAPIETVTTRSSTQRKSPQNEDRRPTGARAKAKKETPSSRVKGPRTRESHGINRSSTMSESNSTQSLSASSSNSSELGQGGQARKISNAPRRVVVVAGNVKQDGTTNSTPREMRGNPPQPKSTPGRGRRSRSASLSVFENHIEAVPCKVKGGTGLSSIVETAAANTVPSTSQRPFSGPGATEIQEHSVEDKIAAIISETRRSKPGKAPSKHVADGPKQAPVVMRKPVPPLENPPPSESAKKGRASGSSALDEQGFQVNANARPPLPWRTGVGRALATHLSSTHTSTKGPQGVDGSEIAGGDFQSSREKALHLWHDEFPLHHERDGPVRVNLPVSSKQLQRENPSPKPPVGANVSMPSPSSFHSNIPVVTKTLTNRPPSPSETDLTHFAANLMSAANDGWRSTQALRPPHALSQQQGPVANAPPPPLSRGGYQNNIVSQHGPPFQSVPPSFQNFAGMPEHHVAPNHLQPSNRYPPRNPFYGQTSGSTPNLNHGHPVVPAAAHQNNQSRIPHPSMNHRGSQDLLNQFYKQGQQHRERDHFDPRTVNYDRHPATFPEHYQRISGPQLDALDGWRSSFNPAYPSDSSNAAPQNRRHVSFQPSMPQNSSHSRQQYPERSAPNYRERYNGPQ